MRRLVFLSLILLGLMAPASWSATLVGQYTFEEGCGPAIDLSGRGNEGTIIGCTYASQLDEEGGVLPDTPGAIGSNALLYDADPDRVVIPTSGWSATAGTIALWVKPSSFPSGNHFFVGHTTEPVFANRLQLYTNGVEGQLNLGLGNSNAAATNVQALTANVWTHLALTWNAGAYVLYINGISVRSGSYAGLTSIAPVAHIGNIGDEANPNGGTRALIDAVHVYDGVLSLEEIQALAGVTGGVPGPIEGFASAATGGEQFKNTPTIVNNCFADNPPATPRVGSMRWATEQGNRYIRVDVGCPTPVQFGSAFVYVRSNTTIDAMNAPSPGFQYRGSFTIDGSKCSPKCNNIIIKGLKYVGDGTQASCTGVAMRVERGGNLIAFDRNTLYKCGNDCLGITSNEPTNPVTYTISQNITVSRNAFISPLRPELAGTGSCPAGGPNCPCPGDAVSEVGAKTAMVLDPRPSRVTVKDNFFYDINRRIPWLRWDDAASPGDTMLDFRNNLHWDIGGESSRDGGAFLWDHARANIVNNYYSMRSGLSTAAQRRYIIMCDSTPLAEDSGACSGESVADAVYASGNVHAQNLANDTGKRTTSTELAADFTNTVDACTAARQILVTAGAPQRSAAEQAAFDAVTLDGCVVEPPPSTRRLPWVGN